jgi:hypothetical protein
MDEVVDFVSRGDCTLTTILHYYLLNRGTYEGMCSKPGGRGNIRL